MLRGPQLPFFFVEIRVPSKVTDLLVTEICRSIGRFGSVLPDSTTVTAPSARNVS